MQDKDGKEFNYTYVALTEEQRREVASIRRQYETKEESSDTVGKIKRLDWRVKNVPTMISLILGVVGLLIFGTGMALVLEFSEIVWGVIVAAVGILPLAFAYPLFNFVHRHLTKKYAPEILRLSDELLGKK